jgi:hypothetical protein
MWRCNEEKMRGSLISVIRTAGMELLTLVAPEGVPVVVELLTLLTVELSSPTGFARTKD